MSMRRWVFGSLAVLLAIGMLLPAGMFQPAWANSELHFGGRLFFPLWDVRGARQTYIVLTREALTEGNSISAGKEPDKNLTYTVGNPFDNCRPRGPGGPFPFGVGNTFNVNRTDLGGLGATPVFVDDVHLEYYGKSCINQDETIHMSCADVDLFLLDDNPAFARPAFAAVSEDQVGALDAHLVINGQLNPRARKNESSLMGTAIIADIAEGWAAEYPAAAAKATSCLICNFLDGGSTVGYEPYPMEAYIPMVFADQATAPGGKLSNLLALWSPNLFPGGGLPAGDYAQLLIKYWDGRERPFVTSTGFHALIRTLGDPIQAGQDRNSSLVSIFNTPHFTCDHPAGAGGTIFENDGIPRSNTPPSDIGGCGAVTGPDPVHKSDNFEDGPTIQTSNPIAWWRFQLVRDFDPPNPLKGLPFATGTIFDHSGRGLVGVVLTSTPGAKFTGVGEALRLWHKDPCELAQSGNNFGPPHLRDESAFILDVASVTQGGPPTGVGGSAITIFNTLSLDDQFEFCNLPNEVKANAGDITGLSSVNGFVNGLLKK